MSACYCVRKGHTSGRHCRRRNPARKACSTASSPCLGRPSGGHYCAAMPRSPQIMPDRAPRPARHGGSGGLDRLLPLALELGSALGTVAGETRAGADHADAFAPHQLMRHLVEQIGVDQRALATTHARQVVLLRAFGQAEDFAAVLRLDVAVIDQPSSANRLMSGDGRQLMLASCVWAPKICRRQQLAPATWAQVPRGR